MAEVLPAPEPEPAAEPLAASAEPAPFEEAPASGLAAYRAAVIDGGAAELFYEKASTMLLRAQLANVIRSEGPVLQAVLFRRVARAWSVARLTRRAEEHLARLVPHAPVVGGDGAAVYWPEGVSPAAWDGLRVPDADADSRRAIDDIPAEELGNAALYLLAQQDATSSEGLARAVCRLFGISRTTADAEDRIGRALLAEPAASRIAVEDGLVCSLRR